MREYINIGKTKPQGWKTKTRVSLVASYLSTFTTTGDLHGASVALSIFISPLHFSKHDLYPSTLIPSIGIARCLHARGDRRGRERERGADRKKKFAHITKPARSPNIINVHRLKFSFCRLIRDIPGTPLC